MSLVSKMFPKSRSIPMHAGGVRKGKTFAALASSSDEEEAPDAFAWARASAHANWADAAEGPCAPSTTGRATFSAAYVEEERAAIEAAAAEAEASVWHQSFSRNLEARGGDYLDLSGLTDTEYADCMTWLYATGWHAEGSRGCLKAYPADLPPRVWVAPVVDRFAGLLEEEVAAAGGPVHAAASALSQPAPRPAKKAAVTVPRFCRASSGGVPCADAACRYVHADTMARLDKPCGFGAACGSSDATGLKRAACLYMHPGETWSAELVVTRPAAAPVAVAEGCGCGH
jgi:hypothetical protein